MLAFSLAGCLVVPVRDPSCHSALDLLIYSQWHWSRFQCRGSKLWLHSQRPVEQELCTQFPLSSCCQSWGCAVEEAKWLWLSCWWWRCHGYPISCYPGCWHQGILWCWRSQGHVHAVGMMSGFSSACVWHSAQCISEDASSWITASPIWQGSRDLHGGLLDLLLCWFFCCIQCRHKNRHTLDIMPSGRSFIGETELLESFSSTIRIWKWMQSLLAPSPPTPLMPSSAVLKAG